jgi:hypothetical protein
MCHEALMKLARGGSLVAAGWLKYLPPTSKEYVHRSKRSLLVARRGDGG